MPRGETSATADMPWLPPGLIGSGTTKQIRLGRPWTSPQRFEHAIDEQPRAKRDGQYDQGTGAPITYPGAPAETHAPHQRSPNGQHPGRPFAVMIQPDPGHSRF